ncbi:putative transporter YwbF [Dictyobacter alpinus]|uniref:Putative transporter YwbF n=2 Tax=Dictyobacter alpinus TaxID=2014873 RepID=A0A402B0S4_9CHLR|nr:putative transporter YwbF [Dictyobacter alpinus]
MAGKLTLSRNVFSRPWSMKLFYLGYFSAMGVYLPYLGLYLGAVGLPGTQIGLIASMFPLASMLMPPLWGVLSDHFGWRKQLLIAALLAAVITSLLIWQITHIFVALFIFIIVLAIAISPTIPLADAITLQWVGEHGGSYGSIRVYGSLGFLIAAIVAGSILNVIGVTSLFLLLAIVFCGPLLTSFFVPGQNKVSMARIKGHELVVLLRDRTLLLFIVLCMIGYGTFAAYNTFFGLYLKSLGVSTSAIGLASGLASLSELPVMMLSGILMKRLGARWLLIIGLSVAVVRWLAYATFTTYPILFAFTLLHGISFASFYVAAITFIDQRVPIHMRTTGQTLFYGTSFGLGTWASTNLFGVLYERLHGSGMYFVGAALCTASIVGLLLLIPRKPARADL